MGIMGRDSHSQPPKSKGKRRRPSWPHKGRGNRDLEEGRAGLSITSRSGGKQSKLFQQVAFPAEGANDFDSYSPLGHMHWWRRLI